MDERTRLIRDATRRPADRRPVNPPVERATTVLMPSAAEVHDQSRGVTYGISGLQAHQALTAALCELEHAQAAFLTPTGLSAVTVAMMAVLEPGSEVLATDAIYGPTRRFCDRFLKRWGVTTRYHPPRATPEEVMAHAAERTRLILMESPGTYTFEVQDAPGIARLARERGVLTMIDNTWAAGLLFKPLDHGIDLSVQALSKYVGGHSDVFGGSIAVTDPKLARRVQVAIDDLGWFVSPDDAWLMLRGLRTLAVRLPQHHTNGLEVARWLEAQPEVARVLHPALPASPDHALWKRDFSGACGLFGVELKPGPREAAEACLDALQLFGLGVSWGGYESLALVAHARTADRSFPLGLEGPLLRLHVGLEAPADLIADLRRGLDRYAELTGA
ncbi:cystathionine beta-lyase [Caulobacter sp. 17J65-9]|uniref:cystathionine beta-lyase n=1 Tax=Caulobacter sp. 17J65-9 TaxID=2709382 RepID=UPI0013CADA37|nr:cystathionine beta-lyase [Caulobacter sp. 17J65-9]NEX91827.1 cystathionine beta-lyase [Caulobacter sp. 17J65-9]